MYSQIKISDFTEYQIYDNSDSIKNLNKINVFIGTNNSGKSRFMRKLFSGKLSYLSNSINLNELNAFVNQIKTITVNLKRTAHYSNWDGYFQRLIDFSEIEYLNDETNLTNYFNELDSILGASTSESFFHNAQQQLKPYRNELEKICGFHLRSAGLVRRI